MICIFMTAGLSTFYSLRDYKHGCIVFSWSQLTRAFIVCIYYIKQKIAVNQHCTLVNDMYTEIFEVKNKIHQE